MSVNRNIDHLMDQMEETFSQRLLRMIDERGMTDSKRIRKRMLIGDISQKSEKISTMFRIRKLYWLLQ